MASKVTICHGQLSLFAISEKLITQSRENSVTNGRTDGQMDRQTGGQTEGGE